MISKLLLLVLAVSTVLAQKKAERWNVFDRCDPRWVKDLLNLTQAECEKADSKTPGLQRAAQKVVLANALNTWGLKCGGSALCNPGDLNKWIIESKQANKPNYNLQAIGAAVTQRGESGLEITLRRLIVDRHDLIVFNLKKAEWYLTVKAQDKKIIAYDSRGNLVELTAADVTFSHVIYPVTPTDPKKEDPKEEDPKKEDPKKEDPKKEDPKKEDPKKEDPKKVDPKKEDPKKEPTVKDDAPTYTYEDAKQMINLYIIAQGSSLFIQLQTTNTYLSLHQ
eukprot:TRINITY_DN325_c0_g1_i11.p2 TRINITY_DN325_c0_g1~~TRINITY_DN325_c0_g1_i11.p2  ORF type:complete len:279 (-),score=120.27 TRINITY_DN325_c0_g1_i11:572-1408(-)